MKNKTIGYAIIGLALVAGGIYVYKTFIKKDDGSVNDDSNKNFDVLLKNLGTNAKSENGSVAVNFNDGKNSARFYNNNRVVFFKGQTEIGKGSYSNGGYTMSIDGGKTVNNANVYTNLNLLIS